MTARDRERVERANRLCAILRSGGPMSRSELARELEDTIAEATVSSIMRDLERDGQVEIRKQYVRPGGRARRGMSSRGFTVVYEFVGDRRKEQ